MRTLEQLNISPTPWKLFSSGVEVYDAEGCSLFAGDFKFFRKTDARLTKSSPRMYEALRKLLKFLDGDDSESPSLKELISEGHAAIAEASGESEVEK